jgi:hypothetical protein
MWQMCPTVDKICTRDEVAAKFGSQGLAERQDFQESRQRSIMASSQDDLPDLYLPWRGMRKCTMCR